MPGDESTPLTVVVRQVVRPGREREFEAVMRGFIEHSGGFEGSSDFHVVRPSDVASREYTVVHRFTSEAARRRFVDSPVYGAWIARIRALTETEARMQEYGGIAGWFDLPAEVKGPGRHGGPPSRPKMAMVTFVGVYPLTSVLPRVFGGWLAGWHPLAVNVLVTGAIVALLTWVVMPLLTRLFAPWLFRTPKSEPEAIE